MCAAKLRAFARVYQRCRETCYGNEETTHFYHAVQVVNTLHELVARNNPTARDAGGPVWCRIQVTQLSEMVDHFVAAIEDVLMKRPTHEFVFGLTGGGTGGRDGGIKTVRNKTGAVFNKLKDLDMLPKDDGLLPVSVGDSCLASRTYEMRLVRSLLMHQVFAKTQACRRIVSEIRSWKQAMDQRTAERT